MFATLAQPVVDEQFYTMFFGYACALMGTARVLHLFPLLRSKNIIIRGDSQRKRYFTAIFGLLASGAVIGYLLLRYGAHTTLDALNYAFSSPFTTVHGVMMYALVIIHAITVLVSLYMLVWFYRNPMTEFQKHMSSR